MERKYQVFISSTYMDLKEIRAYTYMSILELGHIPVGLDIFDVQEEYTTEKYLRNILMLVSL